MKTKARKCSAPLCLNNVCLLSTIIKQSVGQWTRKTLRPLGILCCELPWLKPFKSTFRIDVAKELVIRFLESLWDRRSLTKSVVIWGGHNGDIGTFFQFEIWNLKLRRTLTYLFDKTSLESKYCRHAETSVLEHLRIRATPRHGKWFEQFGTELRLFGFQEEVSKLEGWLVRAVVSAAMYLLTEIDQWWKVNDLVSHT